MFVQRVRAIGVTIALILGAGMVSAVAAPMLRVDAPSVPEAGVVEAVSEGATETPTDTAGSPTSPAPSEDGDVVTEPTEDEVAPDSDDGAEDHGNAGESTGGHSDNQTGPPSDHGKPDKEPKNKPDKESKGDAADHANGGGNEHGKAVSSAARGETPPVGDCQNHGHWVSTVAKGLASCDDNPRPPHDHP